MYTEVLSPSFVGMTFNQASVLCFSKLNLLMLAIETKSDVGEWSAGREPGELLIKFGQQENSGNCSMRSTIYSANFAH